MPARLKPFGRLFRRLAAVALTSGLLCAGGWYAARPFLYQNPLYALVFWPVSDSRADDAYFTAATQPLTERECESIRRSYGRFGLKTIAFNIIPVYTLLSPYRPAPFSAAKTLCGIDVTVRLRAFPMEHYGPDRPPDPPDTINVFVTEYTGYQAGRTLYSFGVIPDTANRWLNWSIAAMNLSYDHAPLEWRQCGGRQSCALQAEALRRPEFHIRRLTGGPRGDHPPWMIESRMLRSSGGAERRP